MNSLKLIFVLIWTLSIGSSFAVCPEGSTIQEGACAVTQGITTLNAHGQCIRLNNTTSSFFFIPMRLPDWQAFNTNLPPGVSALPCTCTDGPVTWTESGNTCNGTVIAVNEGSTSPAADASPPTTGTASFLCSNQTWVYQGGTCETSGDCPTGQPLSWTVGGVTCSSGSPSGTNNQVLTLLIAGPPAGVAEITCTNGTWSVTNPMSCDYVCPTTDVNWGSGSTCSGTVSETIGNQNITITNTNPTFNGSATYACTSGVWNLTPVSSNCCPSSEIWNGSACVACPAGTSTTGAGGNAAPAGCRCNTSGDTWDGSSCVAPPSCPAGSSSTGFGGYAGQPGCYCNNPTESWNGSACVSPSCPAGASTTGFGGYAGQPGCYCNNPGETWDGSACGSAPSCPSGTSTTGAGGNASPAGCNCNNAGESWDGSSCVSAPSCPAGTSTTGSGGAAAPAGCNCNNAGETWDGGACVSGGGSVNCICNNTVYTGASCSGPVDSNNITTQFGAASDAQCLSWVGTCRGSGTQFREDCVACPAGTSSTNTGGIAVNGFGTAHCRCPAGESWNGGSCVADPPPSSCDSSAILACACTPGDSCSPPNYQPIISGNLVCDACSGDGAGNGTYQVCQGGVVQMRTSTTCY